MRSYMGTQTQLMPLDAPPMMPTDAQAMALVQPVGDPSDEPSSPDIYLDQQIGESPMRTYLKAAAFYCCEDEAGAKWALGCLPVMVEHAAGERDPILWRGCYPLSKIEANAKAQGVEASADDILESAYLRILTSFARALEGSQYVVDVAPVGKASIPKLTPVPQPQASMGMSMFESVAKSFINIFLPPEIADAAFMSAIQGAGANPKTQDKLMKAKHMYDRSDYTGLYHVFVSDKDMMNLVKKGAHSASQASQRGIREGVRQGVSAAIPPPSPPPDSSAGGFFDSILKATGITANVKPLLDILLPPGIADAAFDSAIQGITDNPMRQDQLRAAKSSYDHGDYAGVYHTFVSNKELLGLVQKGASTAAAKTAQAVTKVVPGAAPADPNDGLAMPDEPDAQTPPPNLTPLSPVMPTSTPSMLTPVPPPAGGAMITPV